MQISELIIHLQEEAAHEMPPFGAESIKIAHRLGSDATSFLLEQLETGGWTAFLALEALRESDTVSYSSIPARKRVGIYVEVLRHSIFYNAWGLPGYQFTNTAYALISLGEEAFAALKPLLDDQRPAPLSGSQDATTSAMYGNRICDYAWVLICEIRGQSYTYFCSAAERDREIEKLRVVE